MTRSGDKPHFFILTGVDIRIPNQQADRSASSNSIKDSGKNLNPILFRSRGSCYARFSPIQLFLDIFGVNLQSGRAAINDSADTPTMTFTKAGDSGSCSNIIYEHSVLTAYNLVG